MKIKWLNISAKSEENVISENEENNNQQKRKPVSCGIEVIETQWNAEASVKAAKYRRKRKLKTRENIALINMVTMKMSAEKAWKAIWRKRESGASASQNSMAYGELKMKYENENEENIEMA
jgi:hypothetical protein